MTLNWSSPEKQFSVQTLDFQHWDFFFAFAFLIGLYSIHRLTMVQEVGEVEEQIVIQELISEVRRPIRNLSTAAGLRSTVALPIEFFTALWKLKDKIAPPENGAG